MVGKFIIWPCFVSYLNSIFVALISSVTEAIL